PALARPPLRLQEAWRLAPAPAPALLAPGRRQTDEGALLRAVMAARLDLEPVPESAVRAAYDRNPDAFRAPTLYAAAHILLAAAPDDREARASAEGLARHLVAELATNPGAFDRLA